MISFSFNTWFRPVTSVLLGTITSLTLSLPTNAAEKIYFVYDSLGISIPVSDLETYAKTGRLSQQLNRYFSLAGANEEDRNAFREALSTPAPIKDPLRFVRVLNTEEGERLLNYFGKVINVQGGRNGKFIIRGALIQSALDEEGLTLINFLNKLATNVQIDLKKAIDLSQQVELVVNGTYIIGPNATELEVYNLAIDEAQNRIYAGTPDGLYSADMTKPLIFFQFWEKDTTFTDNDVPLVAALNGKIFANKVTPGSIEDSIFYNEGNGWTYLPDQGPNVKTDLRATNDHLVVVNPFNAIFYTSAGYRV